MSNIRPLSDVDRMIQMTDEAQARHLVEIVQKIQPFLNENSNIASIRNSAINAVLLAEVQHSGVPALDQQAGMVERCLALSKRISDAQLRRKWEDFRACLVDQRVTEVQPQFIWAAEQSGVDLKPKVLKDLVKEADARNQAPVIVEH